MNEHIIIKDDKGKKHTFHNLKELTEYLDSFKMSFLPDNFSYKIKEKIAYINEERLSQYQYEQLVQQAEKYLQNIPDKEIANIFKELEKLIILKRKNK